VDWCADAAPIDANRERKVGGSSRNEGAARSCGVSRAESTISAQPRERRKNKHSKAAAWDQLQTHALQHNRALLDRLVGAGE